MGRRNLRMRETEQQQVYANRRRVQGRRGKQLQKLRSEMAERSLAHMYETGGMRRVHLRGRENILKRTLIQAMAFNLALMIRTNYGMRKPRSLGTGLDPLLALQIVFAMLYVTWTADSDEFESGAARRPSGRYRQSAASPKGASTTGCWAHTGSVCTKDRPHTSFPAPWKPPNSTPSSPATRVCR